MLSNSAADASTDSSPQPTADLILKEGKRCTMTNERLVIVANTLMDSVMMNEFGLILDFTSRGGFRQGTLPLFMKLAKCFTDKQFEC